LAALEATSSVDHHWFSDDPKGHIDAERRSRWRDWCSGGAHLHRADIMIEALHDSAEERYETQLAQ
jgi:hypothetical protein